MRTFVASLTAALLLVHAVVGCCRHHEHCATRHDAVAAIEPAVTQCCHHGHHRCHDEERPAPGPCNCKFECKSFCIYLPPEKQVVNACNLDVSFDVAFLSLDDLAKTQAQAATCASYLAHSRTTAESEPPLRLHLLHQIILV